MTSWDDLANTGLRTSTVVGRSRRSGSGIETLETVMNKDIDGMPQIPAADPCLCQLALEFENAVS